MTIDWTLPYPQELTLGLGSSVSICATFSVSGTNVHCIFKGLNTLAKGRYQTYINGVATGIPLTILTDKASLNKVLCSGSHSLSPQASSDVSLTLTVLPTRSPSTTLTLFATRTLTHDISASATRTPTPQISHSTTSGATTTMTLTSTLHDSQTARVSPSNSNVASVSVELRRTWTVTNTQTMSRSARITTTRTEGLLSMSAALSLSRVRLSETHTRVHTESATWGCVDGANLTAALTSNLAASAVISLLDSDIRNGTTVTMNTPIFTGVTDVAALHVPWRERWEARAAIQVLQCPNQGGFADASNRNSPVAVVFPLGLHNHPVAASASQPSAVIVIPPIPDYTIFAQEVVMLNVRLGDMTHGTLCGDDVQRAAMLPLVRIVINVDADALLASAQRVATPIVSAMTAAAPFAAPDLQAMVAVAMMPCSNTYQERTFAMFRALSVFTLDDSFPGVLWGNLIANVGGLGLHIAAVVIVSMVKKADLPSAATIARFPSLYFQFIWQLTFASNAFASVQILADNSVDRGVTVLAGGVLLVLCVLLPGALYVYVSRRVEAAYFIYQYHKWRRADTPQLRVRLLSRFLLPIGRWEPTELRRRVGPFVTLQSRPEHVWMLLPVVSPTLVAVFSLVRNQTEMVCVYVFVALAFLHALLIGVIIIFKPLRSMIEDWFGALGFFLTTLYLCFTAVNLAYPRAPSLEVAVGVVVICQAALLFVRVCYHICHMFIARRLSEFVPRVLLFEWAHGRTRVEDDIDVDECRKLASNRGGQSDLFAELSELMASDEHGDDAVELEYRSRHAQEENDRLHSGLDGFMWNTLPTDSAAVDGSGIHPIGGQISDKEFSNLLGGLGSKDT